MEHEKNVGSPMVFIYARAAETPSSRMPQMRLDRFMMAAVKPLAGL